MIYLHDVVTLQIYPDKCTGCGICLQVCPHNVLQVSDGKIQIMNKDACMECGACQKNCAFNAITVQEGVGCAAAVIAGKLRGTEPTCGCSGNESVSCCS